MLTFEIFGEMMIYVDLREVRIEKLTSIEMRLL